MAGFGVGVVLVVTSALVATRLVVGSNFSCACTASQCANETRCQVTANDSCFRIAVQVNVDDRWDSSGCAEDHPLNPALDFSLTIVIFRDGLAYMGITQCAYNACNSDQRPAGRWSNVGVVKGGCDLLDLGTNIVTVDWNKAGVATSNFRDWCPNCAENIRMPKAKESLCEWVRSVRHEPRNPVYLYVSAGILAAIVLLATILSLVEFSKARKLKRAKGTRGVKKNTQKGVKLASIPNGTTKPPPPTTEVRKESAKELAAAVGNESAPRSATGKSPAVSAKDKTRTKTGAKGTEAAASSVKGKASVKGAK